MAKRADNGDGSCREILSGRHCGKWRVQFTSEDEFGRKQRLSRLFPTKAAGKEFLRGLQRGERIAEARSKRELTLADWFDWLAENDWPESLAETTIGGRIGHFNNYVRDVIGGVPLSRIDSLQVRTFYRKLREDGVGEPTVHAVKRELVRVFNQAISPYGRVPATQANPFCLVLSKGPARDAVALTPEEARCALSQPTLCPERRAMLGLFLLAGVRLSEQMALTRGQILFDQNLIYIDRSVKLGRTGRQSVGLPKGNKKRPAVMCPTLKALLREVAADMESDQVVWSAAYTNQPRMKNLVYATWRTILRDAKLPPDMSPHDCRLTHINWIEKLMPEVSRTTLKEHVGHASEGVTETNYTRPLSTAQAALRNALERVAGSIPPRESGA